MDECIGQHIVKSLAAIGNKGIIGRNAHAAINLADIMQEHIHKAHAAGIGNNRSGSGNLYSGYKWIPGL